MNRRNPPTVRPGSLRYWHNPHNNTVWASVEVHAGRLTKRILGPEARDPGTAVDMLMSILNGDNE